MLPTILIILVVLWALGYLTIPFLPLGFLKITLFHLAGRSVSIFDILIFIVVLWAIEILPSPLRQIVMVLMLFWVLSTLGIIAIAGLSQMLVIAIIVGLVLAAGSRS